MIHKESSMGRKTRQLTIRGFDNELDTSLRRVARRDGISLNRAALRALRKGSSIQATPTHTPRVGAALDAFIGSWSARDERELLRATRAFERVDEDLWS
jgi:hypothetical protein